MSGQVSLERQCFNIGIINGALTFGLNAVLQHGTKKWYVVPLFTGCVSGISSGLATYGMEKNNVLKKLHKTTKITLVHAFYFFSFCTILPTFYNWNERVISYSAFAYKQLPVSAAFYLIGLGLEQ